MAVQLPEAFITKMKRLLQEEFTAFYSSYEAPRHYGVRINTLKISADEFSRMAPFALERVPWCATGYYYAEGERPGKHPYYHAGLYYIQEPSAMLPVELLDIRPGDRVLDLCAAPGGKATQIAAKLAGTGLVVANDNQPERVKALVKNVELAGIRNAIVLNELPERMLPNFHGFFDKILIDAPCSGEGMFRKDEDMAGQWEKHSVKRCSAMQRNILESAAQMLTSGGRIVYSTCTFSPEENEAMISTFLKKHPEFKLVPIGAEGCSTGRADWSEFTGMEEADSDACDGLGPGSSNTPLPGTVRLWPHLVRGEGHFAAVLEKNPEGRIAETEAGGAGVLESGTGNALGSGGSEVPGPGTLRPTLKSAAWPEARESSQGKAAGQAAQVKLLASGSRLGRKAADSRGVEREGSARTTAGGGKRAKGHRGNNEPLVSLEGWKAFVRDHLTVEPPGEPVVYGEHLYLSPAYPPALDSLKVSRPGWYAGTIRNNRFVPSHALAVGLKGEEAARRVELTSQSADAIKYLKGDTLIVSDEEVKCAGVKSPKGWCLVCIDGFPVGWGKWQDGILKNEYPPGWRMT
ncbi:RsmB/NOP family class I SAM-dependent RNA methyltransferase [Paenibacillus sp. J2TS4]|uniref:RsmB/NOP family class I SAM-dependent RNA methyltransferase n=1 Tax=Paenibacillus sp. J2TS4 TaxID=2807194 RepID=UPI001B0DDC0D|nr:RsmF rRNA methyltransferase first C-terminal domain-containing protein [Paenibacillus sp. J2TS4]GIP33919.1 hypothetical protein J2TS4_31290 [Paenibacillus sp. J2TS4]